MPFCVKKAEVMMKLLIASDIHGSAVAMKKLQELFVREKADIMIILGDIYNHGPRNGIPVGYDPMAVADILNGMKDKIIVVKGNCDSEVDAMISEFDFLESVVTIVGGKRVFLTHGHVFDIDRLPANAEVLFYGHVHTGFITERNGVVVANPGSVTFPKNGTEKSYIIMTEKEITLKNLAENIIDTYYL